MIDGVEKWSLPKLAASVFKLKKKVKQDILLTKSDAY